MTANDEQKKSYDAACKQVLAEKGIIANILKACVDEFNDCSISDIVNLYIEGQPEVGMASVEPEGIATSVEGMNTEDSSAEEGTVFYDIKFNAIAPSDGEPIELIINIEAQNKFNPGYPLLKRAIYYCSRMISSQYGKVFVKSHYEKIKKVYSIWICTKPTKEWEYKIVRYQMEEKNLVGEVHAKRDDYDLITPILVCLGTKRYEELTGLLRMLNMVLLDNLNVTDKTNKLADEFGIQVTPHLEKGVRGMCNLSEGIEERGIERGIERGRAEGRIETALGMLRENLSIDVIARVTNLSVEKIKEIAKQNNLV